MKHGGWGCITVNRHGINAGIRNGEKVADEKDEYAGETGLKDDYDGTIVEAWFDRDPNKFSGNAYLTLKIEADDGDEVEQMYGCGAEWDTYDAGKSVAHPQDDPAREKMKKFHVNTKIQRLINTAHALDGVIDAWAQNKEKYGNPPKTGARFANIWEGLRFHWEVETEEVTLNDRQTGEPRKVTMTTSLPTAFLGVAGAGSGAAGAGSASSSTTPAGAGNPASVLDGVDPTTAKQVVALAKANDYNTFVDKVMELPAVLENGPLMSSVADEAWYNTIRAEA
jgi:hypothetical protein